MRRAPVTTQPTLFLSGRTPLSRHTSSMGALHALERVGRQCLALLTLYRQHGPLTDREAARLMQVDRTTINARRAELIKRRLIEGHPVDHVKNPETGISNARWGWRSRPLDEVSS